jgi:predicted GNAT superfamily acetyltransferase
MTLDVLADAGEAAERAAKAAGVVVRELASLTELAAAVELFDEIWAPSSSGSSVQVDLLRALTKAGNYAAGAYDAASGELLGACVGFPRKGTRNEVDRD